MDIQSYVGQNKDNLVKLEAELMDMLAKCENNSGQALDTVINQYANTARLNLGLEDSDEVKLYTRILIMGSIAGFYGLIDTDKPALKESMVYAEEQTEKITGKKYSAKEIANL